jgi:hypothetical protein
LKLKMDCPEFRQNLSLYVDDALAPELRAVCSEHLRSCPLCRTDLAETRAVTSLLQRNLSPSVPPDLASSIKNAVAIELAAQKQIEQTFPRKVTFGQALWQKLQPKLVPYSVGAFASVLFFVMMFSSLISSIASFRQLEMQAQRERETRQVLLAASTQMPYESLPSLPAADYAVRRLNIASESPSLNPQSTFVALTASLTRGEMDNEGIMVVADVLSSGVARITDVIEPPSQPQKLAELEKLLVEDPAFVPATLDRRPENVRVVFMIQKVDVGVMDSVQINTKQQAVKNAKSGRL